MSLEKSLKYHFYYSFVKNKIRWWVRKFKKPYAEEPFPYNGFLQEKKGIRQQIISFAKFLLYINQTIEKGQAKIFRYIHTSILWYLIEKSDLNVKLI